MADVPVTPVAVPQVAVSPASTPATTFYLTLDETVAMWEAALATFEAGLV